MPRRRDWGCKQVTRYGRKNNRKGKSRFGEQQEVTHKKRKRRGFLGVN